MWSAAGAVGVTAIPMHIDAQQFLPGTFSGLEPSSDAPSQCADALVCWWCEDVGADCCSIAFAVTGATSTASARSACRSPRRLVM